MKYSGNATIGSPPNFCDYNSNSASSGSFSSSTMSYSPMSYSPDSSPYRPVDRPYLEVTEQTASQFRFRYKSEMQGTHGAIQGIKSTKKNKTFPTVTLHNFNDSAIIRCTLYTADEKSLHVHKLIGKSNGTEKEDPHDLPVGALAPEGYVACFRNLVIIHVAKKQLVSELVSKKERVFRANFPNSGAAYISRDVAAQWEKDAREETKKMDMNCAKLKFEALTFQNGHYTPIPYCDPVFSRTIKNLKCHVHGQLRIARMSKVSGSCEGDDEIFLLVEKVGKDNIRVVLTEYDEHGKEIWSDYCKFTPTDVHHQFAIVCRTPRYKSSDIKEKVIVEMQLERLTDGARSESREFTFLPSEKCFYQVTERNKRKRVDKPETIPLIARFPSPVSQFDNITSTTSPEHVHSVQLAPLRCDIINNLFSSCIENNNQNQLTWNGTIDYVQLPKDDMIGSISAARESLENNMSTERDQSFTQILNNLPTPEPFMASELFANYGNMETFHDVAQFTLAVDGAQPLFPEIRGISENEDSQPDSVYVTKDHSQINRIENQMGYTMDFTDEKKSGEGNKSVIRFQSGSPEKSGEGNKSVIRFQSGSPEPILHAAVNQSGTLGINVPQMDIYGVNESGRHGISFPRLGIYGFKKPSKVDKLFDDAFQENSVSSTTVNKEQVNDKILASKFAIYVCHNLRLLQDGNNSPGINRNKDIIPKMDEFLRLRTIGSNSVFHTAIIHKQIEELRTLIKFIEEYDKTDYLNFENANFETPLHIAAYDDSNVEVMELFLKAGADPNKLDMDGFTPLHLAVKLNNKNIVNCLLNAELIYVNVNASSEDDGTALHIAAEKNYVELAKKLLDYGADCNSIDKKTGRTPLHVSVINKNASIVSLLLKQKDIEVDKEDYSGCSALQLSFLDERRVWKTICKQLVKHGANLIEHGSTNKVLNEKNTHVDNYDIEQLFTKFCEMEIKEPKIVN